MRSAFVLPSPFQQGTLGAMCVALLVSAACSTPPAAPAAPPVSPDAWATVDGREIKQADVDKAYRRVQDADAALSQEEMLTAKLNLLNDLIVQELLFAKAGALKIEVPQADLDTAFNNAKNNIPDAAFQQELTKRNLTPEDMREGLRRELLTQKVIQQEVSAKVAVSDQEVSDFFNANRAQFNLPEEAYHIAQIVITPVPDPQITNGTGDDATTPQAAAAKAQMLMERLKAGASFSDLAAGYSEDAESAPRGGDLGLVPVSRLRRLPQQLRDAVVGKAPGSVNVASAGGSHSLILVVAHEQAGQRELTTPGVKDRITENLKGRKEQLLRAAYLNALRNGAVIVNHAAKRIVDNNGKLP
jgi:peptidyl-prolyl cis-trans isomerase SurA